MAVSSFAVANAFIKHAQSDQRKLTHMQLQKLAYIAHGFTLAALNDTPLYREDTHAWELGPMIHNLYDALRFFRDQPMDQTIAAPDSLSGKDEQEIVKAVYDTYADLTGAQLSAITHQPDTPWSATWQRHKFGVIGNELTSDYYRKQLETNCINGH